MVVYEKIYFEAYISNQNNSTKIILQGAELHLNFSSLISDAPDSNLLISDPSVGVLQSKNSLKYHLK